MPSLFVPIEAVRFVSLSAIAEAAQPALFTADDGQRMLVTAGYAIFLEGQYARHAMMLTQAEDWKGTLIPSVTFEVDLATQTFEEPGQPSVIVTRSGAAIRAVTKGQSPFTDQRWLPIGQVEPVDRNDGVAYYTGWRLTLERQDGTLVLFDPTAAAEG